MNPTDNPIMGPKELRLRMAALESLRSFIKKKHISESSKDGKLLTEFHDTLINDVLKNDSDFQE